MKKDRTGIIREPEGVDFIVKSTPYTPEEAAKVSAWIKAYKKRLAANERRRAKRAAAKAGN